MQEALDNLASISQSAQNDNTYKTQATNLLQQAITLALINLVFELLTPIFLYKKLTKDKFYYFFFPFFYQNHIVSRSAYI